MTRSWKCSRSGGGGGESAEGFVIRFQRLSGQDKKRASCFLAQTDDTCSFITLTVGTVDGRRRLFKTTSLQIT